MRSNETQKLLHSKGNNKQKENQQNEKKNCRCCLKGLIFKIYKQLLWFNIKKKKLIVLIVKLLST